MISDDQYEGAESGEDPANLPAVNQPPAVKGFYDEQDRAACLG